MINVGITGATGMVGRNILKILEERNFPVDQLYLFASKNSKGKTLQFRAKDYLVEELREESFDKDIDILFFAAGGDLSYKYAPLAREKGIIVIDNSSVWRMDEDVPLLVPEVNPRELSKHRGLIANPNCSTIQSVLPLKPIHDEYGIKRIVFSTYQAVSGSGKKAIEDLKNNEINAYPYHITNNVLPHIDSFLNNGYTKEEMKMVNETRKILNDKELKISATAVRVPVESGHSVSCNLELKSDYNIEDIVRLLESFPGIKLVDDIDNLSYPMPLDAVGTDDVYVGRIRRDSSVDHGLNLWIVADNTRKGAATNSVQIAELLLENLRGN